jgi:hypothetical protein
MMTKESCALPQIRSPLQKLLIGKMVVFVLEWVQFQENDGTNLLVLYKKEHFIENEKKLYTSAEFLPFPKSNYRFASNEEVEEEAPDLRQELGLAA